MTKSKHSKIFPETLEKRVADLSVGRLRPVLYFGKQFGLHPNALVRDPLTVRLSFPDQRREPSAKIGGRVFVESMVDLAGIDEIISLAAAEIDALSIIAIKCKASDGERLALRAGRPDPGPRSSGKTGAVAHLRDNALKPNLAGVRKHFPAIECRSFR
jgi:hypothetical protein